MSLDIEKHNNVRGWLTNASMQLLYDCALQCPLNRVLEFGSFLGKSTACLAQAMKERSGVVVAMDVFPENRENENFWPKGVKVDCLKIFWESMKEMGVEDHVFAIKGNFRDTLPRISGKFGMTFLDGAHTRDFLMKQAEYSWENVLPGGFIVFHDYGHPEWPDVKECVDELLVTWNREIEQLVSSTVVIRR